MKREVKRGDHRVKTTAAKLSAIRAKLRRGEITKLADMTGYHVSQVSRVLRGERAGLSAEHILREASALVKSRRPAR